MENDNDAPQAATSGAGNATSPDAHGLAAMLLIETLLHGLIERTVISVRDAVGFVESAADVGEELRRDAREAPDHLARALTILRSIASSLRFDLDKSPPTAVD